MTTWKKVPNSIQQHNQSRPASGSNPMDEGNNFIPLSDKINDDGSSPISGAPSNREENPSSRPKSRNKGPVQT